MAAGYTLDELRSLYNRNRYTRDVWDKLHDFAPGLTQAELEKIVGETRNEQCAERKKKAVSMRASGAKPEEIAKTIDMSVNTVKSYICKWAKEYAVMDDRALSPALFPSETVQESTKAPEETAQEETDSKHTEEQEKEKREPAVPTPAIPRDCTAFSGENASENGMAQRKAEQVQKGQEKEEMFTNIRPHPEVKPTIPPMPAIPEDCTGEVLASRKASPSELMQKAQGENASAEKEALSVRGLIQAAMKVISEGKLEPGERISVERSELGTTVLIETLA